jgi:hypothetical protein
MRTAEFCAFWKEQKEKRKKSFRKNTKLKLVGGCVCLNALTKNENEKSFLTLSWNNNNKTVTIPINIK